MALIQDDTLAFGEEDQTVKAGKLTHPFVTLFHIGFRGLSIVVYLLCGWFSESFITTFVVVVILLSMDFWTVKNISGRLMVGLRWWNYVDDEGVSHWVFESKKATQSLINERESRIFWLALILAPLFWTILFITALFGFNFKWLLLVTIALTLNGANLYGYIKCKVGAGESIATASKNFFQKQIIQNAVSLVTTQQQSTAPSNTPQQQSNPQLHTI